jgi:membrane-bound lytic murein transglycosylase B
MRTPMRKTVVPLIIAALCAVAIPQSGFSASSSYSSSELCGKQAAGFKQWKDAFKKMALDHGVSQSVLNRTLNNVSYNSKVTRLDRNQKSFKLSFDQFMKKRNADYIISKGRRLKKKNRKLLKLIEDQYGVPSGILLAIWGMETSFGRYTGKMPAIRSLATLAYDCRRTGFFTRELLAALKIVQKGDMRSSRMRGAWAGEIGQTQFLASNYLKYAVDFDGDGRRDLIHSKADALASTANFLVAHGWRAGRGYQPGQSNYSAIKEWNYAKVYQRALATIAKQIDGNKQKPSSPAANAVTADASDQRPKLFFDRL